MTTPHADRDRSDRPWWPPAAPGGYMLHTTEPSNVVEPFLDEPVPFVLTDEPVGERVHGFPLDEGDPGTPLLPVAPEGVVLQCTECPATLADTRGGRLMHDADGCHTYLPGDDAGLDLRAERDLWKARATIAQGKVARVAALASYLDSLAAGDRYYAERIRAALAEPVATRP